LELYSLDVAHFKRFVVSYPTPSKYNISTGNGCGDVTEIPNVPVVPPLYSHILI
jgi:hypothetical protein